MDDSSHRSLPPQGLAFEMRDLRTAMAWAKEHSDVLLSVMTDHPAVPEVIEIYPPRSEAPRWCIWRDYTGRLHVDDWLKREFDLPYSTLSQTLEFISSQV